MKKQYNPLPKLLRHFREKKKLYTGAGCVNAFYVKVRVC